MTMGNNVEIWKPVVGCEGTYEVSDDREVRRISPGKRTYPGRILKQQLDPQGRPTVVLYLRGKRRTFRVSHLIADAFLPPKSSADQVLRHLNDNPADNRIENLAWGTYSDNNADAIRNGKFHSQKGVLHGGAKLTDDKVREIRRLYATGNFTQQELALKFGVAQSVISDIVKRKKWKHVA